MLFVFAKQPAKLLNFDGCDNIIKKNFINNLKKALFGAFSARLLCSFFVENDYFCTKIILSYQKTTITADAIGQDVMNVINSMI